MADTEMQKAQATASQAGAELQEKEGKKDLLKSFGASTAQQALLTLVRRTRRSIQKC